MAGVLIRKPSPTGVDKLVDKLQVAIHDGVTEKGWTDYQSYPRAYKNLRKKDGDREPQLFVSDNNYKGVLLVQEFAVSSFILVASNRPVDGLTTAIISIIFQADLRKLFPTSPNTSRFDEELINDVHTIVNDLGGQFDFNNVSTEIPDVYAEFDIEKLQDRGDNNQPCNVARFDIEVKYDHNCGDVYARGDCTIRVTVDPTAETSLGANDGKAEADVTFPQGNITYLWNDPLAQTTQIATGLAPGSYLVIVTDDNALNCTAQASGTVEAGSPPPTCDLVIDSVTSTGTTSVANAGTATVNFSGNVGIGSVIWEDGQITNPAIDLPLGSIGVAVVDPDAGMTCAAAGSVRVFNSNINSLTFDKVNDWVNLAALVVESNDWSFQAEIATDEFSLGRVIAAGSSTHWIRVENATTIIVTLDAVQNSFTVPTMTAHTFYYLLVVMDKTANELRLYFEDTESVSGPFTGTQTRISRIGALVNGSRPYGGNIDNPGLADIKLTPSQRTLAYNNPSDFVSIAGSANVKFFYNFNETGDAATVADGGPLSNTGTLSGYLTGGKRFETRDII